MNFEWNAPLVLSRRYRTRSCWNSASARAISWAGPEMTSCDGVLSFAIAVSTRPCSSSVRSICSRLALTIAAIAPSRAWLINSARRATSFRPASKSKQPAASSALNSPRLWPARKSGVSPLSSHFA